MNVHMMKEKNLIRLDETNTLELVNIMLCRIDILRNSLDMIQTVDDIQIIKKIEFLEEYCAKSIDDILDLICKEPRKTLLS